MKSRFFSMLLETLGTLMLGNMLTDKGTLRAGRGVARFKEGVARVGRRCSNMGHMDKHF